MVEKKDLPKGTGGTTYNLGFGDDDDGFDDSDDELEALMAQDGPAPYGGSKKPAPPSDEEEKKEEEEEKQYDADGNEIIKHGLAYNWEIKMKRNE